MLGLAPALLGTILLAATAPPDVLISSDGRHVGITGEGKELLVLRDSRSDFVRDNLTELAGMSGDVRLIADWPGAQCNADFCAVRLLRDGRNWDLLIARGKEFVDERALAAACDRVDVVIAARYLPRSCRPRWVKADRRLLDQTGGIALDMDDARIRTVADDQGRHGWWNPQARSFGRLSRPSDASGAPQPIGRAPRI